MRIADAQRTILQNKVAKGFNVDDVPLELCLLQGEVSELFDAWRRSEESVPDELADVAIYVLGLASILEVDLEKAIVRKMSVNESRSYTLIDGVATKLST